jgi:hypothetical protein
MLSEVFGAAPTFSKKKKYTTLALVDRIHCLKNSTEIKV